MGRHATLICALSLSNVLTAAKPQQTLYEATTLDNAVPASTTYLISSKTKGLPTACDIYCPARSVCERCWRGRCDYEGQEQLCFGCAESSCYNERILQNANYREAKQKSTNAAIAMAAAAAMAQDYNLEGQVYDSNRTKNSRGSVSKNKALVIIQSDRASRVSVSNDTSDYHPMKGGNVKPKKNNASLLSVSPTVLTFSPQPEKRRSGHIPDTTPQLSAIVDQRVWVPVTSYGYVEDYKSRQMRPMYYDEEPLGQRTRILPRSPTPVAEAPAAAAPPTSDQLEDSAVAAPAPNPSTVLLKPLMKRARATTTTTAPLEAAVSEIINSLDIEPPAKLVALEEVEGSGSIQESASVSEPPPEVVPVIQLEAIAADESPSSSSSSVAADADAYRPAEELIGSEIEEPSAVHPIAIASLVESLPPQQSQPTPRLVGGFRRNGGLVASFLRPTSTSQIGATTLAGTTPGGTTAAATTLSFS